MQASLFIVATPIGNREDLSERARRVLREVSTVACEDTRHSAPLLAEVGSSARLIAVHEHNEAEVATRVLDRIAAGESVALISDAGTPLLSDPGFRLVQAAVARGIPVVPIPGASAIMAALSAAGLPTDRFTFVGFLSAKSGERRRELDALRSLDHTLVLFEAKHRIEELLADAELTLGDRQTVLARELTKRHETFLRGPISTVRARLATDHEQQLGEFVVLFAGRPRAEQESDARQRAEQLATALAKELPASRAARLASEISGFSKNALYDFLQQQSKGA
ncbi:16S rRNA (cytidine(1402)-2'-O)-methyltransferase [Ahniella affigens]|uniref:Ribosomal RNA small subunit methyltransferase I n=1 Tax=Ahniella affigens TaxID=2021234 RepID=A0A2P1PXW2_9GAMM|nr:16S rRNA (cytidine(1402)-2'-O)-methyltransferase [Ahniella affigens]AVP99644.1 16S rRNA (cytidine(1402)-2'-O)-methyltransferase [Ahniella affigens]